jgi:DNA-directed RNA polymerase alpha subunit
MRTPAEVIEFARTHISKLVTHAALSGSNSMPEEVVVWSEAIHYLEELRRTRSTEHELDARALHCLISEWKCDSADVTRERVAQYTVFCLKRIPNLGRKSIERIQQWMTEGGYEGNGEGFPGWTLPAATEKESTHGQA